MKSSQLAKFLKGRLLGDDVDIHQTNSLFMAKRGELSFVIWPKDIRQAKTSEAGCIVAEMGIAAEYAHEFLCPVIVVDDIYSCFLSLSKLKEKLEENSLFFRAPIRRKVDASCRIAKSVIIKNAEIGCGTFIESNTFIDDDAVIGSNCHIGASCVIHRGVVIKDHVVIGAGTIIGSDAFVPCGDVPSKKLSSLGGVLVNNDVQVGSLCNIDRGLLSNTTIGCNTLIDSMVHIGHDVSIGNDVVIAGQTGIAGCVRIGHGVTIGGQVGVAPHVFVGDNARISGKSAIHRDIKVAEVWSGNPAMPHLAFLHTYGSHMKRFKEKYHVRK